ncbi:PASTA domain-containing protein [Lentzea aerocolonigenes]|uniref:PASTA domain-containing protein n=1 Tax=Lentzea aerocolonigenes TaxID=68170 RepID=UPI0004C3FCB8|nr:PASTA domain-containing protein [Lentzea aerocolonigenes]MCP2241741.1 PASTA domain-containing protein [Lentzea aerocolonigenes]
MPDVVGSDVGRATAVLREAGYPVTTVQVNWPRPPGAVVAQTPQGIAFWGTAVTLSVSSGAPPADAAPPVDAASVPPTS